MRANYLPSCLPFLTYMCLCAYVCVCPCMCVCLCVCVCVCVGESVCACVCTCVRVCTHSLTQAEGCMASILWGIRSLVKDSSCSSEKPVPDSVMAHIWSTHEWVMAHRSSTHEWVMAHRSSTHEWVMAHILSTHEWVMAHLWSTGEWVMAHILSTREWVTGHTYKWNASHVRKTFAARLRSACLHHNESWHTSTHEYVIAHTISEHESVMA